MDFLFAAIIRTCHCIFVWEAWKRGWRDQSGSFYRAFQRWCADPFCASDLYHNGADSSYRWFCGTWGSSDPAWRKYCQPAWKMDPSGRGGPSCNCHVRHERGVFRIVWNTDGSGSFCAGSGQCGRDVLCSTDAVYDRVTGRFRICSRNGSHAGKFSCDGYSCTDCGNWTENGSDRSGLCSCQHYVLYCAEWCSRTLWQMV